MIYKIIYPLYRVEAYNAKAAKDIAENFVHENLHLIRVETVEPTRSLINRLITGK